MAATGVMEQKPALLEASSLPSTRDHIATSRWQETLSELKWTFLTKDGWIGDYVSKRQHF